MGFQIIALQQEQFAPLFELDDEQLQAHGALRMVADENSEFPCRVSLTDAKAGETVLLLNYEHMTMDTPYRSRHAIFVRRNGEQVQLQPNAIPQKFLERPVAVRAFDQSGMMVASDITKGPELTAVIEKLLELPNAEYLHLHWAGAGCYAAKVVRT